MNRVELAIQKQENRIEVVKATAKGEGKTADELLDKLDKDLNVDAGDYVMYQEMKSLAVADGKLTLEEGMTIYGILGNTPEHFNKQPLAKKVIVTKIISELLAARQGCGCGHKH